MLKWDPDTDIGGTFLRAVYPSPWIFEETVARLITLSGQPAKSGDQYKTSVEFVGTFNGEIFDLHDYKEGRELHIGGHESLKVGGLIAALDLALGKVEPTPYTAKEYYDEKRGHSYGS